MSALLLVVFGFVAPAADVAPPPPAPLTPIEDDEDKPPVLQPKVTPKIAPKPDGRARPAPQANDSDGLDPFLIGALQWGVPCATALIASPCLLLAVYGCPVVVCLPCVLPAANGYLATVVGDRFGGSRAPAIWPVLAAYGATLATSVAALLAFVLVTPALAGNLTDPVALGGFTAAMAVAGGASLAVPVAYALTAEPKRADDDGTEVPGWFAPHHPTSKPKSKSPTRQPADAPPRLAAMRF